jgi:CheY-like chemotaxis protein
MASGTILAVDDDKLTLLIIRNALEEAGFDVVTAHDGAEALSILTAQPDRIDVAVVDRMMPGKDGMAVLAAMRQNAATADIPVVLQTAASGAQDMQEGIEAGAFYYVTKPYEEATLVAIVRSAMESRDQYKQLTNFLRNDSNLLDGIALLERGTFRLSCPAEAKSVVSMVCQHAEDPAAVSVGLMGLVVNAIEHGNLGVGGAEKENLISRNAWDAEIQRRLALPENAGKTVVVEFDATDDDVTVTVTDQGPGFDWRPYLDNDYNLLNRVRGRGIVVARTMSFQTLSYLDGGRQAIATFTRG